MATNALDRHKGGDNVAVSILAGKCIDECNLSKTSALVVTRALAAGRKRARRQLSREQRPGLLVNDNVGTRSLAVMRAGALTTALLRAKAGQHSLDKAVLCVG